MSMHGIDISHHQSGLQLAKTDAQFVGIKLTEGASYHDPAAAGFVQQARSAKLPILVYHFHDAGVSVNAELNNFVGRMKQLNLVGAAIPALDWESSDTGKTSLAKQWMDAFEDRTGISPLLYCSQSVANGHDWSAVAKDRELWVARYNDEIGPTGAWKNVRMWQYTDRHSTGGMAVDGDRFYGDKTTWHELATGGEDVSAKDVWAEEFAKWAPDATQNEGKKIDAAQQLNQARGYAEDAYDRIKTVEKKLDQILKKLG